MNRPTSLWVGALAMVVIAVAALALRPGAAVGSPTPTDPPVATPGSSPKPTLPSAPISIVDLDTADGHTVRVKIEDREDIVVRAATGQPGDGASVEFDRLKVENVDAKTLRLTWIDYGIDSVLTLFVFDNEGTIGLALVRPEPTEPADAIGYDRVMLIGFEREVDAAEVVATVRDGVDTPG